MKKKKVVVTFCEAGQGHIVTAEAIADSLEKKYSNQIEVVRDYVFRDSPNPILKKYEEFNIKEVKAANKNKFHLRTQMLAMKIFGERFTLKLVYSTYFKKVKKALIEEYKKMNADAIVSTYFATYHMACEAKKKGAIDSLVVAYDPDHNVHGWWDRRGDLFIVNNPRATEEALKKGFDKNKIKTVNFMVRQSIVDSNLSKQEYREKYNLPKDKFTIILADGAYAAARLEDFTDQLLKTKLPITIIPVCGKNEKLLEKYNKIKDALPENITFLPQPFLKDIHEFYGASDLFITKAGPNAITDCAFMHTPIMTNFYSGNIEKATNALFIDNYKMGVYCPNPKEAQKLIEQYIENPTLLDEYRKNTYKIDKYKNGADEIADIIAQQLGIQNK